MVDIYAMEKARLLRKQKKELKIEYKYNWNFFSHCRGKGFWWFRIMGYGFSWKKINNNQDLLFSERTGRRGTKIGKWYFHFLKK